MSEHQVKVWGKPYTISIQKLSKTVYEAVGEINGEPLRVKDRTLSAAAKHWVESASYRANL